MNLGTSFTSVQKLFSKHRHHQSGGHDLYRDWGKVLVGFFGALFIIFVAAGYVYYTVSRGGFAKHDEATFESPTINRSSFQVVVESYEKKDALFSELKQTPVDVVDPAR